MSKLRINELECLETGRSLKVDDMAQTFDYEAGIKITSYSQMVRDSNGDFWRVSGSVVLPYVTTGSGLPEDDAMVPAGDAVLRQDLADPARGAGLVGFDPELSYLSGTVGSAVSKLYSRTGYTVIRPSLQNIAANVAGIASKLSGVITGDSLSFNAFGYPAGWPTSGGGYATANPFGLSSWAHLLRDFLVTSTPAFTPIKDVNFDTNAVVKAGFGNTWDYGLNGRHIAFEFSSGNTLRIRHTYSGSPALLLSYAPPESAVTFKVDGVSYSTLAPDTKYQSRGYLSIPCYTTETVISEVAAVAGGSPVLTIYGTTQIGVPTPALTGKGAYTSAQILAEYPTLVGDYAPDYIFYIIGANDIGGVPVATFKQNLKDFVDLSRAAKPNCEIVLISTPPSSSFTYSKVLPYIQAMAELAESDRLSLIDLYSLLVDVPVSEYRFDNIHFNTAGDTLVFNMLRELCFPSIPINTDNFTPVREAHLGHAGIFYHPLVETVTVLAVLGSTVTFNPYSSLIAAGLFPTAEYSGAGATSLVEISPPVGYKISHVQAVNISGTAGQLAEITTVGISANPLLIKVGISRGGVFVDLINTGKYLLVSMHRL